MLLAPPQEAICALLFKVEAVVPYSRGDLLSRVHELGACDVEEYTDAGTLVQVKDFGMPKLLPLRSIFK